MDFELGEELIAVQDLAGKIFADRATPQRLAEVERSLDRLDVRLWSDLAAAGLLGVALPEKDGGGGLGAGGLCALLEAQGRAVVPVPAWTAVVAALVVAGYGSDDQRRRVVPATADGSARWTLALEHHPSGGAALRAEHDGGTWRLSGASPAVPSPFGAEGVLVAADVVGAAPAITGEALFLVDAGATGVAWERTETTSRETAGNLTLNESPASMVGEPGCAGVGWARGLMQVALAALQLGVAEGALAHAAAYVSRRQQFGRPLGAFQAVQHQLADCSIDVEALRVTMWQGASALDETGGTAPAGLGSPPWGGRGWVAGGQGGGPGWVESIVAAWWAAEAGLDVVYRVQHVHGGIGVDVSYPVHRHFLWGRQIASALGGASALLAELGDALAERAPQP